MPRRKVDEATTEENTTETPTQECVKEAEADQEVVFIPANAVVMLAGDQTPRVCIKCSKRFLAPKGKGYSSKHCPICRGKVEEPAGPVPSVADRPLPKGLTEKINVLLEYSRVFSTTEILEVVVSSGSVERTGVSVPVNVTQLAKEYASGNGGDPRQGLLFNPEQTS